MKTKTLAVIAIILWVGSAAFVGFKFVTGTTVTATDGRDAIVMTAGERNLVLGEMRGLLNAVQEIIAAVNAGDMEAVKESALLVGMADAGNAPQELILKLPLDFKQLGFSTHEGFDKVALAAEIGPEAVLESLEENMVRCIACHEAYRLSE